MTHLIEKTHIAGPKRHLYQHCANCDEILAELPKHYEDGTMVGVITGIASGAVSRYVVTHVTSATPKGCTE